MKEKLSTLRSQFSKELSDTASSKDLEDLRIRYLGKKGIFADFMQDLRDLPKEQKPSMGKLVNELKQSVSEEIDDKKEKIAQIELNERLADETIDITLPGRREYVGRLHPVSQMIDRVTEILIGMGFSVYESPEVDSDYYNYGGLNYSEDHPARDMQDTYYLSEDTLLRSHTTAFQQRIMEEEEPPIRSIAVGKCFRNETISSRSHVIFHQVDGLYIDTNVTFADLLATKEEFYKKLFGEKIELRVRGSYFPFVEPGMEIDIRCTVCKGRGCRLCKDSGWLEVCGAGMVHPEVLKAGGLDPEKYSGFAWGGGIERLYLLMHGINDIRLFMENDMRFLEQFP